MSKMTRKRWVIVTTVVAILMVVICAYLFRSQIWVAVTCSGGTPQAELEGPVTQSWVATFDGPAGDNNDDDEWATAIQTDNLGNVYVTGSSGTVKYDSTGNELWFAYKPTGINDAPYTMAVDAMNNIYITGSSTVKYDSAGNLLWKNANRGSALALDTFGDVYVTGSSGLIKYDNAGDMLWNDKIWNGTSLTHWGEAIAVNDLGWVYVAGDFGTFGYDRAGNLLSIYPIQGYDLAVDAYGGVYVTGYYGTAKYAGTFPGTNLLWENDNMGSAIAVDTSGFGSVYVTGYSGTFKYGIAGNLLWKDTTLGSTLVLDTFGNLYITVENQVGPYRYTTVKFSKDGERLWTATLNGPVHGGDEAQAIAIDPSGNVYVTGTIAARDCMSFPPLFWDVGGTYRDYATVKYANQVE